MKVSISRFDNASSLIACCNCGVITSDWDCRISSRGPSAILSPATLMDSKREAFTQIQPAHVFVGDQGLRTAGEQHLSAINDAGPVDDIQRLADIVVGDQHADAARPEIEHEVANIPDRQGID